ncbi:MFS transporter [Paenibacillus arenosi]|uniref:MFS transporter n=1 Tax=Paenibacillus arenosi TaxID=2774142 RepID=A0ABR9ASF0_9BACL|nr:MFS transporter [Paenibacillus arenosi]MBD8497026.1 MFS transporter [Paenibacillus arenosi]
MGKSFKALWFNHSAAELASSLWLMTWIAAVYQLSGSAALAGGISLVRSLSALCSGLTLPLWYKRWSVETVLRRFQFINIIVSLFFVVLLQLADIDSVPLIVFFAYISNVISGYSRGCANAATTALYPRLVKEEQRAKSNSIVNMGTQFVSMFGWTVGGILIQQLGSFNVLLLSAVILSLAALLLAFIPLPSTVNDIAAKKQSMWSGWGILFRDSRIRIITTMDIIEGLANGIWIGGVTLLFVQQVLNESEAWWGYINAAYYAGSIFGAYLIMKRAKQLQNQLLPSMIIGSVMFCLMLFAYAFTTTPWIALVIVFIMGPATQMRDVSQLTYTQLNVDLDQQPNLYAAKSALGTLLFGLSIAFTGLIADLWGAQMVYILAGVMYSISSLIGFFLFSLKKHHTAALQHEVK